MMPRAVVYCPHSMMERRYLVAAQAAEMELYAAPSLQEWSSQLFRDSDAIGILWSQGGTSAAETIRRLRQGNVLNRVVALIHYMEPDKPARCADARAYAMWAGADDAQCDEIHVDELAARLKALASRVGKVEDPPIEFAGCSYDTHTGELFGPSAQGHLTQFQGDILELLARYPGKIVTRYEIMNALYGGLDEPDNKIVDVFVCKLRAAIAKVSGGMDCIATVWGRGFVWVPAGFTPELVTSRRHPSGKKRSGMDA